MERERALADKSVSYRQEGEDSLTEYNGRKAFSVIDTHGILGW
jgi:hypothetical protein